MGNIGYFLGLHKGDYMRFRVEGFKVYGLGFRVQGFGLGCWV